MKYVKKQFKDNSQGQVVGEFVHFNSKVKYYVVEFPARWLVLTEERMNALLTRAL